MSISEQPGAEGASAVGGEVRVAIVDGVGWISFNRPQASNAANPPMMRALCEAIDAFAEEPAVRALVIRGEGRHFLAGGDFGWLSEIVDGQAEDAADEIYRWFQGASRRLAACPKPTVAAISGGAFTVGAELALACDVRLMDRSAFFAESWLELALIAPLGGAMWLPRLVGLARAKEILLECKRIGAEEALEIGLANELLDTPEELFRRAQERAIAMAARPALAFARMKQLIHSGMCSSQEEAWQAGISAQAELLRGDDFRSAVRSRRATARK